MWQTAPFILPKPQQQPTRREADYNHTEALTSPYWMDSVWCANMLIKASVRSEITAYMCVPPLYVHSTIMCCQSIKGQSCMGDSTRHRGCDAFDTKRARERGYNEKVKEKLPQRLQSAREGARWGSVETNVLKEERRRGTQEQKQSGEVRMGMDYLSFVVWFERRVERHHPF